MSDELGSGSYAVMIIYEGSEVFEAQGWQLVHPEGGQESTHSIVQEGITPAEEYAEWEEGAVDGEEPYWTGSTRHAAAPYVLLHGVSVTDVHQHSRGSAIWASERFAMAILQMQAWAGNVL